MTEQEFRAAYPLIAGWIQQTLAAHATAAKTITSFGFIRLPQYYHAELLASSRAVVVDHIVSPRNGGEDALSNLRSLCRLHDNRVKENALGDRRSGGKL